MKKALLDENLPKPLKKLFSQLDVKTVADLGWQSKENGELLQAMTETGIEILITVDKNLHYQQNLEKYSVQVVVLLTYDNRYKTLASKISLIESAIVNMTPDQNPFLIDVRT